jgi:hypothetical protein
VKKADRDRIGERDGWVCCFCGEPVDKDHVWQKSVQPAPDLVAQAAAILADGVDERIAQWAGSDIGRVLAAFSVWPKNPYSVLYMQAFAGLQALRTELSDLKFPNSRNRARKLELDALTEEAEKICKALSDEMASEYDRRHPQHEALRAVRAVYLQRNKDHPSVEHRVPVIAGGSNSKENLAIAHLGCNLKRGGNAVLINDLMVANHQGVPLEGRAAFLAERQRHRDEFEQQRREAEIRRQKWARALSAALAEDDELRRELRRLGDRLRRTLDETECRKIKSRRGRVKAKREKLRRTIDRLKRQYWWMSDEDAVRQLQVALEAEPRSDKLTEAGLDS